MYDTIQDVNVWKSCVRSA